MYIRFMLIAFLTNGLGAFGMHIVSDPDAGNIDRVQYMALWYLTGCAVATASFYWNNRRLLAQELLIGGAMGVCSFCGVSGMTLALSAGVPGFVVFPVAMGGGMLMVVATGIGLFGERMGMAGYFGIAIGMLALMLLASP